MALEFLREPDREIASDHNQSQNLYHFLIQIALMNFVEKAVWQHVQLLVKSFISN